MKLITQAVPFVGEMCQLGQLFLTEKDLHCVYLQKQTVPFSTQIQSLVCGFAFRNGCQG